MSRAPRRKESSHRWVLPDGRGGVLWLRWEMVDGRVGCVGMSVECDVGSTIDAADLRLIRLGKHLDAGRAGVARRFLAEDELARDPTASDADGLPLLSGAKAFRRTHRAGQRLGYEHYSRVALDYQVLLRVSKRPTATLAAQYGVSHPTAARWVMRAREEGLLPPTRPGRAG